MGEKWLNSDSYCSSYHILVLTLHLFCTNHGMLSTSAQESPNNSDQAFGLQNTNHHLIKKIEMSANKNGNNGEDLPSVYQLVGPGSMDMRTVMDMINWSRQRRVKKNQAHLRCNNLRPNICAFIDRVQTDAPKRRLLQKHFDLNKVSMTRKKLFKQKRVSESFPKCSVNGIFEQFRKNNCPNYYIIGYGRKDRKIKCGYPEVSAENKMITSNCRVELKILEGVIPSSNQFLKILVYINISTSFNQQQEGLLKLMLHLPGDMNRKPLAFNNLEVTNRIGCYQAAGEIEWMLTNRSNWTLEMRIEVDCNSGVDEQLCGKINLVNKPLIAINYSGNVCTPTNLRDFIPAWP